MAKAATIDKVQISRDRPIPIALIDLGGLLPVDLQKFANKLNRLKNQNLFIFHPISGHVELPTRDLPHGYSLNCLYNLVSKSLIGTGYSFGIGITHEILEDTRFNWHDEVRGVGVITLDHAEKFNPIGRTMYQYLAYLTLCEALCISGRTQFEHKERCWCLFDACVDRDDLKICLQKPQIHCKDRLLEKGFSKEDLESAYLILAFVKTRRFSNVLQDTLTKGWVGLIAGLFISQCSNLFIKNLPTPWIIGIIIFLLIILVIIISLQYKR